MYTCRIQLSAVGFKLETRFISVTRHERDIATLGGGLINFDDVSAAVDGFWSGCRGLSLICRLYHIHDIQSWHLLHTILYMFDCSLIVTEIKITGKIFENAN